MSLWEAWRRRRTSYRSGRLELLGVEKETGPQRKTSAKAGTLDRSPLKGKFRWRRY